MSACINKQNHTMTCIRVLKENIDSFFSLSCISNSCSCLSHCQEIHQLIHITNAFKFSYQRRFSHVMVYSPVKEHYIPMRFKMGHFSSLSSIDNLLTCIIEPIKAEYITNKSLKQYNTYM